MSKIKAQLNTGGKQEFRWQSTTIECQLGTMVKPVTRTGGVDDRNDDTTSAVEERKKISTHVRHVME